MPGAHRRRLIAGQGLRLREERRSGAARGREGHAREPCKTAPSSSDGARRRARPRDAAASGAEAL